jgi:hypothetical protein
MEERCRVDRSLLVPRLGVAGEAPLLLMLLLLWLRARGVCELLRLRLGDEEALAINLEDSLAKADASVAAVGSYAPKSESVSPMSEPTVDSPIPSIMFAGPLLSLLLLISDRVLGVSGSSSNDG